MQAKRAKSSANDTATAPYRIRDIAIDVGLLMVAATFILLGSTGLIGRWAGIDYPLSGLMVTDAALTGLLAGCCLLGWLIHYRGLIAVAAVPLAAITLYTLVHNVWVGGPWVSVSWVSGGPRILSAAALLLLLVAACTLLGMKKPWHRVAWAGCGLLAVGMGGFSLLLLLLPSSRFSWSEGFVSGPILATLYSLLGGSAFIGAAWRGNRRLLPLGSLTITAVVAGVMASCLAWYTLSWSAQNTLQNQVTSLMDNATLNARHAMRTRLEWIQRLAWRHDLPLLSQPDDGWLPDVHAYFQHAPYLKSVALFDSHGELIDLRTSTELHTSPIWQNEPLDQFQDMLLLAWPEAWTLQPKEHPNTLLLVAPTGNNQRHYVAAEVDLIDLLTRELSVLLTQFHLSVGGDTPFLVLRHNDTIPQSTASRPLPHLERRHIGLPGGAHLTLDAHLGSRSTLLNASIMPASFAIAGLTLSYLLALSLGLIKLVRQHSGQLLIARQQIKAQYDLEQRFRSLYLYHPDGVFSLNHQGCITNANKACSTITGRNNSEILGNHFSKLLEPQDIAPLQKLFTATLAGQTKQVTFQLKHRDGHIKVLDLTTMPMIIEGVTQGVFGIVKDTTVQHEQKAQLAYQATHDLLTHLPNYSEFEKRLKYTFSNAQKTGHKLIVLHLDLDGFKAINDGLGHPTGNQLLIEVANRLQRLITPGDTLARLTGDEFALLLSQMPTEQAAIDLAEQILGTLSLPFKIDDTSIHISGSIGIACNTTAVAHAHELMQRADLAMGEAKQQGRNTWQWYQGDEQQVTEASVMLRHDLQAALKQQQFELYYQPIVDATSGSIRGVEALIRWHHPQKGIISPGIFIPLAEQTGQIIPLGRWVLQQACQDAAKLHAAGKAIPVAVNISSLQFRRAGFLGDVQRAVWAAGLPANALELEVTESVLLDGADKATDLINQLKLMGIKVALDDFGTGFSSLSYLRDLPIHKVKLDRAFIHDITNDHKNAAIVQGVITMAHYLGLVVVAEGIETYEQQQDLVQRHCDLLQGFLFAKPMPLAALLKLKD
ncbi:MAG: EAL domain-containing protein [Vreelandella alkaliphila]|uniref:putative bifunctional diguanylate cyclase/phosphodiesterase n=1 Tax=Vreelandella alkaliphila TaxID=272774 RepID=UPI003F962C1A